MPIPAFREDGWLPEGHHSAHWSEVLVRFGGLPGTRRASLTAKLVELRAHIRGAGIRGRMLLDGSYIFIREYPGDFDVLLIAHNDIQSLKDSDTALAALLDAESSETRGYSLFFARSDSPTIALLCTLWDTPKQGLPKGIVEVEL